MGVRIPRNDAWGPYKRVRFVLVRQSPWTAKPLQGLILDWRKTGTKWRALVIYVDDTGPWYHSITAWLDPERLTPIRADPNIVDLAEDPMKARARRSR